VKPIAGTLHNAAVYVIRSQVASQASKDGFFNIKSYQADPNPARQILPVLERIEFPEFIEAR